MVPASHKDIISRQHSEYHNISGSTVGVGTGGVTGSKKVGSSHNNNRPVGGGMLSNEQTKFIQQFSNMSQTSATPSDGKTAANMINLKKNSSSAVQVSSTNAANKPPVNTQDGSTTAATTDIMSLRKDQQAMSSSKRSLLKSGGPGPGPSVGINSSNA